MVDLECHSVKRWWYNDNKKKSILINFKVKSLKQVSIFLDLINLFVGFNHNIFVSFR